MLVDGDIKTLRRPQPPFFTLQVHAQQLANRQPQETFVFAAQYGNATPLTDNTKKLVENLRETTRFDFLPFELNSALREAFKTDDKYPEHELVVCNPDTTSEILLLLPRDRDALKASVRSDAKLAMA